MSHFADHSRWRVSHVLRKCARHRSYQKHGSPKLCPMDSRPEDLRSCLSIDIVRMASSSSGLFKFFHGPVALDPLLDSYSEYVLYSCTYMSVVCVGWLTPVSVIHWAPFRPGIATCCRP
ncbi:hypothetical protein CLF_107522 [Clonorchis sinensis]|uniref:Uncharacterized protein n=1 Tax=Clonorchis sinensis TaxID=79923 RepID=G7YQQ1_CLOSI|nr:hypothetical protein CLF_107522 [Clonorchis sinensis]